jgi:hypothetical protein
MKHMLTRVALASSLVVFAMSPAALASGKRKKPSPEHVAAVKQCRADYATAVKEAKTKRGKERSAAMTAAKKTEKECIANAPK